MIPFIGLLSTRGSKCQSLVCLILYDYSVFSEKIKNVFPNPFSDQVTVFYNCENSSQIDVSLISLTGEQLHQQFFSIEKGLNKLVVELNQVYSSGIYFLVIEDEVIKLIKSN